MADFNRGNRYSRGGGGGFKRRDFNDRGSRGPVEMHKAVCDNCGNDCEVPFRPTSGKPVFCSNCFEKNRGSDSQRPQSQDWNSRRNSEDREMFEAVCDNCGKNCKVPFRPTSGKPVYCSECFEKGDNTPRNNNRAQQGEQSASNQQLENLNNKLDRILKILESAVSEEPKQEVEVVADEPIVEESPKKEKKKKPAKKEAVVPTQE